MVLIGSVASLVVAGTVLLSLCKDIVINKVLFNTVCFYEQCASNCWAVELLAH